MADTKAQADNAGSCLCEAVKFKLYGRPLQCAVCHCDSCQQFSGSAFMVNCWYRQDVRDPFIYGYYLVIDRTECANTPRRDPRHIPRRRHHHRGNDASLVLQGVWIQRLPADRRLVRSGNSLRGQRDDARSQ